MKAKKMQNVNLYPGRTLAVTAIKLKKGYSSIKSIFSEITACPECKGRKLKNSSNGELFCRDCGLVIF